MTIRRGIQNDWTVTLTDTDITGWTVRFVVKKQDQIYSANDDSALLEKNITSHDTTATGVTTLTLTSGDTASLSVGSYKWGLRFINGSGVPLVAVSGDFTITSPVVEENS